jgi:hypothetical protein
MQLPTTTYRHGRNQGRRGNNTGVSSHCFTAHPVMEGEKRHCTHLTAHCTSLVTLEGGCDKVRTPRFQGFGLIRSASTRPRPGLNPASTPDTAQQGTKDGMAWHTGSFQRFVLYDVTMSGDGPPFLGHVATVISTGIDKTSFQDPHCLGLLSSYKRRGPGSTTGDGRTTDNEPRTRSRSTSQAIILYFLFLLFETWAHRPLSQACNPYANTSVQGNTKSPLPRWT